MHLSGDYKIFAGLLMGILTGFVLVKSDLCWRKSVPDFLTLKDGRIVKTILLFIAIGTFSFFFLRRNNILAVHVLPSYFFASLAGGVISGLGLVLAGFTPFSSLAALGCGRFYTIWVILGMVLAFPLMSSISDFLANSVYSWGNDFLSTIMEPQYFLSPANPALYIVLLAFAAIFLVHFTIGDSEE